MTKEFTVDGLWQFSLEHYAKNKNNLLWLQDKLGLNINLVLSILYACANERLLGLHDCINMYQQIQQLDSLTQNFRSYRKGLKNANNQGKSDTYNQALERELDFEKKQQVRLVESMNQLDIQFNSNINSAQISQLFALILKSELCPLLSSFKSDSAEYESLYNEAEQEFHVLSKHVLYL